MPSRGRRVGEVPATVEAALGGRGGAVADRWPERAHCLAMSAMVGQ